MALQHLRSNTASKRPTPASMADGQLAINTNATSPGLFFKDAGGSLIKIGPVHVGTSAPNSSPAGSSGNAIGEQWLDTSGGGYVFKVWDGSAWRSEAGEFVDVAGDTMTGDLVMNDADIVFEGSTEDGFETTLTVVDPTADRTITLPNVTGTVVTTGDSGTVTSTMIADGTIVNADVNASAAIADTKLDTISTAGKVSGSAITSGTIGGSTAINTTGTITTTGQATLKEIKETVYTLGTSGSIALDPANGSIQSSVLTGAPTFTDSLENGQTIVLMLEGGASYTVTWPTITWVTSGGNVAPTLTAKDTLVIWKVSTTLYGAYVGSYV